MATVPNTSSRTRHRVPVKTPTDQLTKDRLTAAVVLVAFVALMALLIWLASMGGGSMETYDPTIWPMM